jgi:2-dehydropantoate 2-reductase
MRVCVFGAGAVGSVVATRLAAAHEAEVSVVARGPQLRAIVEHGLVLHSSGSVLVARPAAATDTPSDLPPQDMVFVTLKATAQSACATDIAALVAPGGCAVFMNNGIPWWWKAGEPGAGPLPLVDTDGAVWRQVGPDRALGCVVYSASEVVAPGVVRHDGGNRWLLAEASGTDSPRLARAVGLMERAGLSAEASPDLRREVWAKLLRNTTLNSLCALTRLTVDGLAADPGLMVMAHALIDEVAQIATAHAKDVAAEHRAAHAALQHGGGREGAPMRGVRPSMLQDVLAERPIEVEAIAGQVQQLARESGTPCPTLDAIVPLLRGLAGSLTARSGALRH